MAILLRQLCEKASYLYGMRILAGENGTGNIVQWIHTLEDVETGGFIHGGELIFTTGIAQEGNEWLLEFVENLYEREASGLVVNVGPYIFNTLALSIPQLLSCDKTVVISIVHFFLSCLSLPCGLSYEVLV